MNTVVQVAKGPNAKVYHHHEFTEAGFNPAEVEKVKLVSDERFPPLIVVCMHESIMPLLEVPVRLFP